MNCLVLSDLVMSFVIDRTNIDRSVENKNLFLIPLNLDLFAKVIFKGNAATFGYITSFVRIGAAIGTIFLASRKPGVAISLFSPNPHLKCGAEK
jgi:hypothetical protein